MWTLAGQLALTLIGATAEAVIERTLDPEPEPAWGMTETVVAGTVVVAAGTVAAWCYMLDCLDEDTDPTRAP